MSERVQLLADFLERHGADEKVFFLPADASSRYYGRGGYQGKSCIVMDAPPSPATRTKEFIAIADLLRSHGLAAPEVFVADQDQGFLLLEDLGAESFSDHAATLELYSLAYEAIEALQTRVTEDPEISPAYDTATMKKELLLFRHWYCPAAGLNLPSEVWKKFDSLTDKSLAEIATLPQRFVLRDCHVDNFLYRADQTGLARCGILDFQDGGWGCALYDVTSLVFDARRDVPVEIQEKILCRHAKFLGISVQDYHKHAAFLIMQRALKVLGIFARLNARDGKGQYLAHLERCWQQIMQVAECLPDWFDWLVNHMPIKKPVLSPMLPPDTAMFFAAGQGTRMGALGQNTPKPLLEVAGKSLIKRGQDNMRTHGVSRFIVNAHHHADQVSAHFQDAEDSQVIIETTRLETGGGVRNALPMIKRDVFWVVNGDSLWQGDLEQNHLNDALQKIIAGSEATTYQESGFALLLLIDDAHWQAESAPANFVFSDDSHTILERATGDVGYGYSGVMLLHRGAIFNEPIEYFSLNRVFDDLIDSKRLFGLVVDWDFYHVGTPEALTWANKAFVRG